MYTHLVEGSFELMEAVSESLTHSLTLVTLAYVLSPI